MNKQIRVGLAISDIEYRILLTKAIDRQSDLITTCIHDSLDVMVAAVAKTAIAQADVLVIGLEITEASQWDNLQMIINKFPLLEIIVLSTSEESELIVKSLKAGVHSFISKKTPIKKVIKAIHTVYNGGAVLSPIATRNLMDFISNSPQNEIFNQLTNRQLDIIKGISDGLSYKMIADKLGISIDTVRSHIKNIYKLLNVHSKIEVINLYRRNN